ncbi:MAG: ABC transporter permease [Chitinophagales bacterium]
MVTSQSPKIITSTPLGVWEYSKAVWRYKNLIWVFAYQELKGLYAQTYFGVLWGVIRPLFTLFVFTVIFKFFLHVPTETPYYLFAFTGMIAWNFFSLIAGNASGAIIQKQNLIRKMYFPKLILPLSKVIVASVETGISLILLFMLIIYEKHPINGSVFLFPFFVLLNIVCGFVIAIWMNALNVRFRDLNQIVPAIIGIAIWVTPVFYPTTVIPAGYDFFVYVNPMAGVIKGYRFSLLGEAFPEWQCWVSILMAVIMTFAGVVYLSKIENEMVDYI